MELSRIVNCILNSPFVHFRFVETKKNINQKGNYAMENCIRNAIQLAAGYKYSNNYFMAMANANGGCFDDETRNEFIAWFISNKMSEKETVSVVSKEEQNNWAEISENNDQQRNTKPAEDVIHTANTDDNQAIPKPETVPSTPMEHPPLLFDTTVYQGRNNLIYSPGGVGKSILSMEIARSNHVKRPVFILREDYSGNQIETYRRLVGEKAIIITMRDWEVTKQKIKEGDYEKASLEIALQYADANYRKMRNIADAVLSKMGLSKGEKADDFTILNAIIKVAIDEGADLICVDSLNALTGGRPKIDRHIIERIFQPFAGKNITFLLIHHTNAKGNLYGGVNSFDAFDHVYQLGKMLSGASAPGTKFFELDEVKSRHGEEVHIVFTRAHDGQDVKYDLVSVEPLGERGRKSQQSSNLAQKVKAALSDFEQDDIPIADLFRKLGGEEGEVSEGGLKKKLKDLEDEGVVSKADGRLWERIHRN
jgi:KaiC/GvpD/RAD55 family RecA-like ATPase